MCGSRIPTNSDHDKPGILPLASSVHGLRCGVGGDIEHIGPGAVLVLDLLGATAGGLPVQPTRDCLSTIRPGRAASRVR